MSLICNISRSFIKQQQHNVASLSSRLSRNQQSSTALVFGVPSSSLLFDVLLAATPRGCCLGNRVDNSPSFNNRTFYTQSFPCYSSQEKHDIRSNTNRGVRSNDGITTSSISDNSSASTTSKPYEDDNTKQQQQEQQQSSSTSSAESSMHNISYIPSSLQPYAQLARLDKPIGTFLLLHPCLWSTALASSPLLGSTTATATVPPEDFFQLCALFSIGSFIMRGAGCTINDMWDSQYDKNVERTRNRPLANGDLSYNQAWKFLALQLSAGLGVLLSLPNVEQCLVWGVASLPLVATYPLMKRYTNYPQLILGMTFNWGAIMGWVAVNGDVNWNVVGPLYVGSVAWTLIYDTLYAHQDKVDDSKLGLKSTALTFGEKGTKPILTALTGVAWGGWMLAGYNCGYGEIYDAPYYYMGISSAGAHLLWQIYTADLNNPTNLAERFRSNNLVGWIVFGSCVAGNVMSG